MLWIEKINAHLDELGLYPDVEAFDVTDARGHIVLVDTQESTVYTSAEGCYRALSLVEPGEDARATWEAVCQALSPNIVHDMAVIEDCGLWRQDPQQIADEEASP